MTCLETMESGGELDVSNGATWGPETEKGYPVHLTVHTELRLRDGVYRLSMMAELTIKESEKLGLKAVECGGQCLDDASSYLKACRLKCAKLEKLIPIWRKWHLNDMKAGSPAQEACLEKYEAEHPGARLQYDDCCKILGDNNLLFDKSYLYKWKPYQYGSSWLTKEIPHDVLVELCTILDEPMKITRYAKGEKE